MFHLDSITSKNDNEKWPYKMLIIGPSGSGKTSALINLIQKDNDNFIGKIYLYVKNLNEYSNTMDNVYDNDCNPK